MASDPYQGIIDGVVLAFDIIKDAAWNLFLQPYYIWNNAPIYVRWIVRGIILLIAIAIVYNIYKNQDVWKTRRF